MTLYMYTIALLLVILAVLPQETQQCAANGVCGGGPYCAAPPPPPSCSCPRSHGCGSYGCYRLRARGSKLYVPKRSRSRILESDDSLEDDREILRERLAARRRTSSEEELERASETAAALRTIRRSPQSKAVPVNPNRAFLECCMDRKLPDACLSKCNFNSFTKDALTRMYFKQDPCPLPAMADMQFCAAMGRDHRECCARNGVTTTLAGPKCLTFCNQKPGRITPLDMSYVPCFDRFESMKSCFWHDLTRFYKA